MPCVDPAEPRDSAVTKVVKERWETQASMVSTESQELLAQLVSLR